MQFWGSLPLNKNIVFHVHEAGTKGGLFKVLIFLNVMTIKESCWYKQQKPVAEDLGDIQLHVHDSLSVPLTPSLRFPASHMRTLTLFLGIP